MKAEIVLNGSPKDIQTVISMAIESGMCQSFHVLDEVPLPSTKPKEHHQRGLPTLKTGDRVKLDRYRNSYGYLESDVGKTGTVQRVMPSGKGWQVYVMIDGYKELCVPSSVVCKI